MSFSRVSSLGSGLRSIALSSRAAISHGSAAVAGALNDGLDAFEHIIPDRLPEEATGLDHVAKEVRDYFNGLPEFQYEYMVGVGGYGVALCVRHTTSSERSRRLIVKRARHEAFADDLRNEIDIMSKLNGSAHIAGVVGYKDDREIENQQPQRRRLRLLRRLATSLSREPRRHHPQPSSDFLIGLSGPTLVLDYLENGTLDRLLSKLQQANKAVPNRVLWSIFLCLIRACAAMNDLSNRPNSNAPELEEIEERQGPRVSVHHGDMHLGNILFGDAGDFPEHAVIPPAKLIDFGLAIEHAAANPLNVMDAAKNMVWLVLRRLTPIGLNSVIHQEILTLGVMLLGNKFLEEYPTIDLELRDLVVRCLAMRPGDRPLLSDLLRTAKHAVATKGEAFYGPLVPQESDATIQSFVQEHIYDA
ncbi:kinase-like domain-containing protein [Xylaria venustula]|nr:kinase-like domain-containing protein [Xylaria venustula]